MKSHLWITLLLAAAWTVQAQTLPAPEKDEMSIADVQTQLFNLDGKVIETLITSASSIEQIAPGKYRASCYYYKGGAGFISGEWVLIPEEGKAFFEELAKKDFDAGSSKTIYLLVHNKVPVQVKGSWPFKLEAVGSKYRKSKNEYGW